MPHLVAECRAWDLAATEDGGDYTAGVRVGRSASNDIYITKVIRFRHDSGRRNVEMRKTAEADGTLVPVRLPQDPGQAGKDQRRALVKLFSGFPVTVMPVSGSKEVRADPLSSQVNEGNVYVVEAPWTEGFIDEMRAFPIGSNDDMIDAAVDAFTAVAPGMADYSDAF